MGIHFRTVAILVTIVHVQPPNRTHSTSHLSGLQSQIFNSCNSLFMQMAHWLTAIPTHFSTPALPPAPPLVKNDDTFPLKGRILDYLNAAFLFIARVLLICHRQFFRFKTPRDFSLGRFWNISSGSGVKNLFLEGCGVFQNNAYHSKFSLWIIIMYMYK